MARSDPPPWFGGRFGGFSAAAARLSAEHGRTFSRQIVWRWWSKRESTGFPGKVTVADSHGKILYELLDLDAVCAWHKTYVPSKGGRPRKERKEAHVQLAQAQLAQEPRE